MQTRIKEIYYKNGKIYYMPQVRVGFFKWADFAMYEQDTKEKAESIIEEKLKKIEEENSRKEAWKIVKVNYTTK